MSEAQEEGPQMTTKLERRLRGIEIQIGAITGMLRNINMGTRQAQMVNFQFEGPPPDGPKVKAKPKSWKPTKHKWPTGAKKKPRGGRK